MNGSSLTDKLLRFPPQTRLVNGRRLAYRLAGQGPAIVLLHGISSGSGSWVNQLEQLAADYTLVAWDAPGYGQSEVLANDAPSALEYAEMLHGLIEGLGLEQPLLLGHSLGAMIVAAYADRYPGRIRGLVLANPAQGYGHADADTQLRVYRQRPEMLRKLGHRGLAAARGPVLLSQHASEAQLELVAQGMMGLHFDGFLAASYLLAYDDIWNYLTGYGHRLGVIYGEEDVITAPTGVEQLIARHGRAMAVPLAGAGHASYIDQPERFNQALIRIDQTLLSSVSEVNNEF
ncbi:alpha/beta fold hydrolase [Zobellella maritima]|uniref:alpha/beta fold hydrolase n=1 Tax=Zobellella maritima TaxID=2059725 RepID=UPI000E30B201|nr:alpha/beta hydrolase [Zobellella maritima]